ESHPTADDVTRPHRRRVPLLPQETGPCQDEDTLTIRGLPPMIVHPTAMHERKHIRVTDTIANGQLKRIQHRITLAIPDLRLTAVQPETIPTFGKLDPDQVFPV